MGTDFLSCSKGKEGDAESFVLRQGFADNLSRLNLNFLSYNMTGVVGGNQTPSGGYGGVLHAIIGTLEITAGAMVISIPIGLMCAVYLVEYSNRGKLATTVSLLVDVMSGIPSIVAGLFAFSMFTILIGPGTISASWKQPREGTLT